MATTIPAASEMSGAKSARSRRGQAAKKAAAATKSEQAAAAMPMEMMGPSKGNSGSDDWHDPSDPRHGEVAVELQHGHVPVGDPLAYWNVDEPRMHKLT